MDQIQNRHNSRNIQYETWRKYRTDKPAEIFSIKHGENIEQKNQQKYSV